MNSRDAAFDESLKEIIEATAAEAAAATDPPTAQPNGSVNGQAENQEDPDSSSRKKRKRTEDDVLVFLSCSYTSVLSDVTTQSPQETYTISLKCL
jgi:hypothetical protein